MKRLRAPPFPILIALVGLAHPCAAWSQGVPGGSSSDGALDAALQEYLAAYASPSLRGPAPGPLPVLTASSAPTIPADSLTAVVKQYCVVLPQRRDAHGKPLAL